MKLLKNKILKYKVGFELLLMLWFLLFIYLDIEKAISKIGNKIYLDISVNKSVKQFDILDINEIASLAKKQINSRDKVLFISSDAYPYMYFNFLVYPIIAKWSNNLNEEELSKYNYIIFYNFNEKYRNEIIKNDIN